MRAIVSKNRVIVDCMRKGAIALAFALLVPPKATALRAVSFN